MKATAKRLGTVEQQFRAKGFSPDGVAYRPIGNTPAVKDKIKAAGGVYDRQRGWISPVPLDFIECERLVAAECFRIEEYEYCGFKYSVVLWNL